MKRKFLSLVVLALCLFKIGILAAFAGATDFGANSMTLQTPLTVGNGGTGSATAGGALTNLGAAASGANSDITSANSMTSASSLATVGTVTSGTWNSSFGNSAVGLFTGSVAYITASGTTTLTATSPSFVLCDTTNGNQTIAMPSASTCAGKFFFITNTCNSASNTVTINRAGSDTFGSVATGETQIIIGANTPASYVVFSDGLSPGHWYYLANACRQGKQTGAATGSIITASGQSLSSVADVATGSVLVSQGTSTQPAFSSAPSVTSTTLSGTATNALDFTGLAGGIRFKSGSNGRTGTGTLSGGTATVSNTSVTANSVILIEDTGGTVTNLGSLYEDVSSRVAGTSFVVKSSNALDASNFSYIIFEKN